LKHIKYHLLFILLFAIFFACFIDYKSIGLCKFSIGTFMSALLALLGFIFTARTFIIFKMNDAVYENENYQKKVEKLKHDGAYKDDLYAPLQRLDEAFIKSMLLCFVTIVILLILGILPSIKNVINTLCPSKLLETLKFLKPVEEFIIGVAVSSFIVTIFQIIANVNSMNKNIKSIMDIWKTTYNNKDTEKKIATLKE